VFIVRSVPDQFWIGGARTITQDIDPQNGKQTAKSIRIIQTSKKKALKRMDIIEKERGEIMKHRLLIDCLHNGMAHCACEEWLYSAPRAHREVTKKQIKEAWKTHAGFTATITMEMEPNENAIMTINDEHGKRVVFSHPRTDDYITTMIAAFRQTLILLMRDIDERRRVNGNQ